jgi:two-component system cell cycle response regulator DivK
MRILVADDDRVLVQMLAGLLRAKGHQVTPVFDAMQVLMFAMRKPPPEAIVLDINMPGGTGLECIKRLKSSQNTALIPIIVLSGSSDPQMPEKIRALGAETFLSKPLDPAALLSALAQLVPSG